MRRLEPGSLGPKSSVLPTKPPLLPFYNDLIKAYNTVGTVVPELAG